MSAERRTTGAAQVPQWNTGATTEIGPREGQRNAIPNTATRAATAVCPAADTQRMGARGKQSWAESV